MSMACSTREAGAKVGRCFRRAAATDVRTDLDYSENGPTGPFMEFPADVAAPLENGPGGPFSISRPRARGGWYKSVLRAGVVQDQLFRFLLPGLLLLLLAGGTGIAFGCSVPVFRYALERWPADNYLVVVFHQGALTPEQATAVRDLDRSGLAGQMSANLVLRTVDLAAATDPQLLRWWQPLAATTTLPAMVLLYPPGRGLSVPAWHGPLTGANVRQLLDSPGRREIARRLLQGDSAVWVLLESGDQKRDTAAALVLETRLKHLAATLTLPELNPAEVIGGATVASQEKLKVVFSTLRVSRESPTENVLVRMLLHTEEDLAATREPIAFPLFGRGRVLHALVGPGINHEMIDEAGGFLTGACSCVVKEENPGSDLLLAVDWARLVEPLIKSDEELPPLPGLAEFAAAKSPRAAANPAIPGAPAAGRPAKPGDAPPAAVAAESRRVANPLIPGLIVVVGLVGGVLLGATWWLLRHRG